MISFQVFDSYVLVVAQGEQLNLALLVEVGVDPVDDGLELVLVIGDEVHGDPLDDSDRFLGLVEKLEAFADQSEIKKNHEREFNGLAELPAFRVAIMVFQVILVPLEEVVFEFLNSIHEVVARVVPLVHLVEEYGDLNRVFEVLRLELRLGGCISEQLQGELEIQAQILVAFEVLADALVVESEVLECYLELLEEVLEFTGLGDSLCAASDHAHIDSGEGFEFSAEKFTRESVLIDGFFVLRVRKLDIDEAVGEETRDHFVVVFHAKFESGQDRPRLFSLGLLLFFDSLLHIKPLHVLVTYFIQAIPDSAIHFKFIVESNFAYDYFIQIESFQIQV